MSKNHGGVTLFGRWPLLAILIDADPDLRFERLTGNPEFRSAHTGVIHQHADSGIVRQTLLKDGHIVSIGKIGSHDFDFAMRVPGDQEQVIAAARQAIRIKLMSWSRRPAIAF